MKQFFKKVTQDPYIDWLIIFSLGILGIIFFAVWSYSMYYDVREIDYHSTATTTRLGNIDIQKIETIAEILEQKKAIYEQVPRIDLRDPSL